MAPLIETEALRHGYRVGGRPGLGARWRQPDDRAGRVRRRDGTLGVGQVDLDVSPGLPRQPDRRPLPAGRRRRRPASAAMRSPRSAIASIGFVFQSFNLLPRTTALENVELPLIYRRCARAERRRSAPRRCSTSVGLADRADHTPAELSGGQQQRVAIARALVTSRCVLLADEPTGALDSAAPAAEIMAIFGRAQPQQGMTIVLVTHEAEVAAYADRIVTFRDGRVVSRRARSHEKCLRRSDAVPLLSDWRMHMSGSTENSPAIAARPPPAQLPHHAGHHYRRRRRCRDDRDRASARANGSPRRSRSLGANLITLSRAARMGSVRLGSGAAPTPE